MNLQTSAAPARLLDSPVSLAPAQNHPIGIQLGFFLIVGIFLAVLGLTMAVGHLREQRRQRRAQTDVQASHRDTQPPTR